MIVVTVPARNESKNLRKCVESLLKETPQLGEDFRIVIAEDGSTDGTDIIAQDLERMYPPVIHLHSSQKLGKGLALTQAFNNADQVKFFAVQTVFEGYDYNSQDKLRKNQLEWDLKIPMAHAAGNPRNHEIPEIMRKYRSGGTPWKIIIDPQGKVAYNNFHIEPPQAVALIKRLLPK